MAVVIAAVAGVATTSAVTGLVVAGITISAVGAALIGAVVSTVVGSALISKPSARNFNATSINALSNQQVNNAPIPVVYGTRRVGGAIVWMITHGNIVQSKTIGLLTDGVQNVGATDISVSGRYNNYPRANVIDIVITFAGDSNEYVVTDFETTGTGFDTRIVGLTIDPPLIQDVSDNVSIQTTSTPDLNDRRYLTAFLVVSEGEIEGYDGFWFSGKPSTNFKFENDLWIEERYGTDDQLGFDRLTEILPEYTADTHRLAGTAYLWINMFFNSKSTVYPEGVPLINTLVKGVKTYDPRTTTTQWGDNPVLCVRDYLTNARYGRGIDPSLIDDASFILAANYCDELVAYNGIDDVKRYTCNGLVETQNSSLDIIKKLLSSCRGLLIFSGGLYKVIIDKPEMAVFTFSEDNIIGGWKIKLGSKNSQYNRMRANFVNADKEYQPDIAIVDLEELRQQDGGLLETMIDLPFTTNLTLAKAIITINLNQSRYAIICELTATIEALRVEVGDVVYINHKTPGWVDKKFRIMRVTLQNNDEVRILANEYADEVYDLDVIDPPNIPVKIEMDDLSICLPPANLVIEQSVINLRVYVTLSWDASPDGFVDYYEIGVKPNYEQNWKEIKTTNTLTWSGDYSNQLAYLDTRVRAVNTIGVPSIWVE